MRVTRNMWWTKLTTPIIGFDEPGEGTGEGASGEGAGEGANGAGEGAGEGQGAQGTSTEGEGAGEDVSGLKSALEKERNEKKALDKQLKALQKKDQAAKDAELSEVDRLKKENEAEKTKAANLAQGFRRNAVNSAILKAAAAAKFLDPSDALRAEVIDAVGVEQDEDDPSKVTIDEKSVTAAVKALATSKKHYVASGDGSQQQKQHQAPKSGSSFGGGAPQSNLTADEQALAKRYPALARRT